MRIIKLTKRIGALLILISLGSCYFGDHNHDDEFLPVVMDRSDFENSLAIESKRTMNKAGKIYVKDQLIFIADENKGFHIFDNSNSSSPSYLAFIRIPGATDLAIRNDVFYANQAVDLVAFKIDLNAKKVNILKRIKNVFPEKPSPRGTAGYKEVNKVLIDWKKR